MLSSDDDKHTKKMIDLIINNDDKNQLIDDIEGVQVWEKVENRFTCVEFLNQIGV